MALSHRAVKQQQAQEDEDRLGDVKLAETCRRVKVNDTIYDMQSESTKGRRCSHMHSVGCAASQVRKRLPLVSTLTCVTNMFTAFKLTVAVIKCSYSECM